VNRPLTEITYVEENQGTLLVSSAHGQSDLCVCVYTYVCLRANMPFLSVPHTSVYHRQIAANTKWGDGRLDRFVQGP
jgi:hypothetical protein